MFGSRHSTILSSSYARCIFRAYQSATSGEQKKSVTLNKYQNAIASQCSQRLRTLGKMRRVPLSDGQTQMTLTHYDLSSTTELDTLVSEIQHISLIPLPHPAIRNYLKLRDHEFRKSVDISTDRVVAFLDNNVVIGGRKGEDETTDRINEFLSSLSVSEVTLPHGMTGDEVIKREFGRSLYRLKGRYPGVVYTVGNNAITAVSKNCEDVKNFCRDVELEMSRGARAKDAMKNDEVRSKNIRWNWEFVLRLLTLGGVEVGRTASSKHGIELRNLKHQGEKLDVKLTVTRGLPCRAQFTGCPDHVALVSDILDTQHGGKYHYRVIEGADHPHSELLRFVVVTSHLHKDQLKVPASHDKVWVECRREDNFTMTLCGEDEERVSQIHDQFSSMIRQFRVARVALPGGLPHYIANNICRELHVDNEIYAKQDGTTHILVYGTGLNLESETDTLRSFLGSFIHSELECIDTREVALFKKLIYDTWYLRSRFPSTFVKWSPNKFTSPLTITLLGPESEVNELRCLVMGWTECHYPVPETCDMGKLQFYIDRFRKLPLAVDCRLGEGEVTMFGSEDGIETVKTILDTDIDMGNQREGKAPFFFEIPYEVNGSRTYYKAHLLKVLFTATNSFLTRFRLARTHMIRNKMFFTGPDAQQALQYFISSGYEVNSDYQIKKRDEVRDSSFVETQPPTDRPM